jgi:hypothetical protein
MATPLPKPTTPEAFKAYLDKHVNGGKPVAGGSVYKGSTVGDQWLAFYADKHGQFGSKYTLLEYEEAFIAYITTALLNTDLQAGIGGAATTAAQAGAGAAQGGLSLYQDSVFRFLGQLSNGNLWVRVAKVAVGGALLIVGAAKLTGADKQVAALGKAVAKAPLL